MNLEFTNNIVKRLYLCSEAKLSNLLKSQPMSMERIPANTTFTQTADFRSVSLFLFKGSSVLLITQAAFFIHFTFGLIVKSASFRPHPSQSDTNCLSTAVNVESWTMPAKQNHIFFCVQSERTRSTNDSSRFSL